MSADLLPCPFCGGSVKLERTTGGYEKMHGNRQWWGVVCRNNINLGGTCAIQQIPSASEDAAVKRWNLRAALHAQQGEAQLAEDYRTLQSSHNHWQQRAQNAEGQLRAAIKAQQDETKDAPAPGEELPSDSERAAALADRDQVPYLIVFDDADQQAEPVIGGTRARYRFKQISGAWNAHLYVKIASNSRDEKFPSFCMHMSRPAAPAPATLSDGDSAAAIVGHVYQHVGFKDRDALVAEVRALLAAAGSSQGQELPSVMKLCDNALEYVNGWNACLDAVMAAMETK